MRITTRAFAHRALKGLKNYRDIHDKTQIAERFQWINDDIIGIYSNPPDIFPSIVVITENALYLAGDVGHERISFNEIESVSGPQKGGNGELRLNTAKGERLVPIAWREGKFEDVFSFVRFLSRVLDHRANHRRPSGTSPA